MQDISLHLLDIIENSVRAESKMIELFITMDLLRNELMFQINDNGCGMDEETLVRAQDPFYTSKMERIKKVGLGIPLFKQNAEMCNGLFEMTSEIGNGTTIKAVFQYDHIDRLPIGNLEDTMLNSIIGHSEFDFCFKLKNISKNNEEFNFELNTLDIKSELGDIPITYPDVISFIRDMIKEGIKKTNMEEV